MTHQSQRTGAGCEDGARAAFAVHQAAEPIGTRTGQFDGWTWHRGATRVTWHQQHSPVVYKIETPAGQHANENEHRNARLLKERGKSWAPDTALYAIGQAPAGFVLAMPYYPVAVLSHDEIPSDALQILPDRLMTNFRRTAPPPGSDVKVIDLGDVIPWLK